MHNYSRGIVVVLLNGEGTDVWGSCDQCGGISNRRNVMWRANV